MPKEYKKKGRGRPKKKKNEGKPKNGNYLIRPDGKCDTGRETKYRPEYCDLAFAYCLLNLTDEEIAEKMNICPATLYNWRNNYPDFLESFRKGREEADAKVASALFVKATGFYKERSKTFFYKGEIVTEKYDEYYPPDTKAIEFWMLNRSVNNRSRWFKSQSETPQVKPPIDDAETEKITEEMEVNEAAQIYKDLIQKTKGS